MDHPMDAVGLQIANAKEQPLITLRHFFLQTLSPAPRLYQVYLEAAVGDGCIRQRSEPGRARDLTKNKLEVWPSFAF